MDPLSSTPIHDDSTHSVSPGASPDRVMTFVQHGFSQVATRHSFSLPPDIERNARAVRASR